MEQHLQVERMGRAPYGPMLVLQEARHAAVCDASGPETLFLLEHDPVITYGRNAGTKHVLASPAVLATRGVELFASTRGGDATYHGPGQLVGYPILRLEEGERDIKAYVYRLEEVLIRTATDFGVTCARREGMRGIWVGDDKLAAVGVRIARWVTMHGFALNVTTDLAGFGLIVPCGLQGFGVTSLARLLREQPNMRAVEDRVIVHMGAIFGRTCSERAAVARTSPSSATRAGLSA